MSKDTKEKGCQDLKTAISYGFSEAKELKKKYCK
jgi:hypothetical protein